MSLKGALGNLQRGQGEGRRNGLAHQQRVLLSHFCQILRHLLGQLCADLHTGLTELARLSIRQQCRPPRWALLVGAQPPGKPPAQLLAGARRMCGCRKLAGGGDADRHDALRDVARVHVAACANGAVAKVGGPPLLGLAVVSTHP